MGAVFPYPPHHHGPLPAAGRRERAAVGGRRKGQFQDVRLLLQDFQGRGAAKLALRCIAYVIAGETNVALCAQTQEKIEVAQKRDVEGMGIPEIKYGESMCFVQHVSSGLWLTYAAVDAKSARLGPLKRKARQTLQYRRNTHTLFVCAPSTMFASLESVLFEFLGHPPQRRSHGRCTHGGSVPD